MDDEHTAGYKEPCAQCSALDWGVSEEGRFYCRSCHNVIERTKEVVDTNFIPGSSRVSTISRGSKTKKAEQGRQWVFCEAFQFILKNQADALLRLGVNPAFKDEVLLQLWRLYLQKIEQAFTHNPVRSSQFKLRTPGSDSESAAESSAWTSDTDGGTNPPSIAGSSMRYSSDWSVCSGPVGDASYSSPQLKRTLGQMRMQVTLSLIHIALTWCREPLTLSDLLRLVKEGHVPYLNAYEELPEEMKLLGKSVLVFKVESIPSYRMVHEEAQALILLLKLPAFPPINRQSMLHPALLSLRYLTDVNLPDDLHPWLCRLMEHAGMADQTHHTFDPLTRPVLPQHDMLTAALIIVTMKLVFGLDDHTEWDLSNKAADEENSGTMFSLRRWFRLLQAALVEAQKRRDRDTARKQWRPKKPLFISKKDNYILMKKRRIAEQVQICFEKLSSCSVAADHVPPSSFVFCWGDEDGADGPSMHHKKLDAAVSLKDNMLTPSNPTYWHPALRPCMRYCKSHYSEMEESLPRMFVWVLKLFSFLLNVKPSYMYKEVLKVERQVFGSKTPRRRRARTRTEAEKKRQRDKQRVKTQSQKSSNRGCGSKVRASTPSTAAAPLGH